MQSTVRGTLASYCSLDAPVSPTLDFFFLPSPDGLSGRTGVKLPRHFQWRELVDSSALSSAVQAGFSGLAAAVT